MRGKKGQELEEETTLVNGNVGGKEGLQEEGEEEEEEEIVKDSEGRKNR